jgi:hypothetical protein
MDCRGLLPFLALTLGAQSAREYFVISVVDEATGRGVPMVRLSTTNRMSWYTDSNGLAALNEPSLAGRDVFFEFAGDGYEYPKDGFGYRGKALKVSPGGGATVKMKRTQIAERLYRVTGEGIYRDTVLAGRAAPIRQPLLNAQVTGQDTVMAARYRGKLYWFWGDTDRLAYPLGNFAATGATSELPGNGGLDPSVGVDLAYFTRPDGFVKPVLDLQGEGLKWLFGLMTLNDPSGRERLVARYYRMKNLGEVLETGLAAFDDTAQVFRKLVEFPPDTKIAPDARPVRVAGYYYFAGLTTAPWLRVKAEWNAVQHLESYQAFTCPEDRCGWRPALGAKFDRAIWQVRDVETGAPVPARMGTVNWNAYRKCWIAILQGTPGTVYYAEADSVTGPWAFARKVVQHEHYNFYWPGQHAEFDQEGGRVIYFEGTYTDSFSDAKPPTPRYNYNQIMYRLRLDDERLELPAAVYRMKDGRTVMRDGVGDWAQVESIAWFALPGNQDGKHWDSPYSVLPVDR